MKRQDTVDGRRVLNATKVSLDTNSRSLARHTSYSRAHKYDECLRPRTDMLICTTHRYAMYGGLSVRRLSDCLAHSSVRTFETA